MEGRTGSFWLVAPSASVTTPRTAYTLFPRDLLWRRRCLIFMHGVSAALIHHSAAAAAALPGRRPPDVSQQYAPAVPLLRLSDDHLRVQPPTPPTPPPASHSSLRDGIWLVTAYLYYCTLTKYASRCVCACVCVRERAAVFHLINSPCWHMGQIDQLGCQLSWQISPSVSLFLGPSPHPLPPNPPLTKTHFSLYSPLLARASTPTRWQCAGRYFGGRRGRKKPNTCRLTRGVIFLVRSSPLPHPHSKPPAHPSSLCSGSPHHPSTDGSPACFD